MCGVLAEVVAGVLEDGSSAGDGEVEAAAAVSVERGDLEMALEFIAGQFGVEVPVFERCPDDVWGEGGGEAVLLPVVEE